MAQGIEASLESTSGVAATDASIGSRVARAWMWLGVGGVALVAGGFLLHQLMAWPPHEDETLALFVGRDSLPGVVEHVTRERGGAPLHFLTQVQDVTFTNNRTTVALQGPVLTFENIDGLTVTGNVQPLTSGPLAS